MRVAKEIPTADANLDDRDRMREERASRYPEIEVIPTSTGFGALSAGPNDPLDEDLWGDPVNLAYPLAYRGDTTPDKARADNARARFKQFFERYANRSSRAVVHERIVRAQIRAGSLPAFDGGDPNDRLLPSQLAGEMRALEKYMSKTAAALEQFRKAVTGASTADSKELGPKEALEKVESIIAGLDDQVSWRNEALALIGIAKSVVHTGTVGEPASLGLMVEDHSDDPNWTPAMIPNVNPVQDRVMGDAIETLTPEQAVARTQNPDPNPDLPAMGPTPGPRDPQPLPSSGDITMPPSHPSTMTGREVEGVTKRQVTLEDAYTMALALGE